MLQNKSTLPSKARKKVLFLYAKDYQAYLAALKRNIVAAVGNKLNEYEVNFACSAGLDKALLDKVESQYDYICVACPATAAFICPEGITFNQASGSLYKNKFLILIDPQHVFSIPHGDFLLRRYLDKVFRPEEFISFPPFTWNRIDKHEEYEGFYKLASEAKFMAVDIETSKKYLHITCISFSILLADGRILTAVLDCEDDNFFLRIRNLLSLPCPKTFQNGIYDNLYLLRWNMPTTNWMHDTAYNFHAIYSELPKDLGFLAAFYIRNFEFWKQEGRAAKNKEDYHRYNAKDTYATLCVAIAQLSTQPAYAKKNFEINFPNVFPCLYMSAHGLRVDIPKRTVLAEKKKAELQALENSLRIMSAVPDFNAGSSPQVLKLFKAFGFELKSSVEKDLISVGMKHPILQRFVEKILDIRERKKAISSYLEAELLNDRLLYDINPCGTETGRFASKKSSFWCGVQIQNQPAYAKVYVQADVGWTLCEIDNEQSESRTTAYLAQDTNLIATLESGKDFHSLNAVKFFGADYEAVKTKQEDGSDSKLRALAKRINHAVSYNMGAKMFVYQAGTKVMEMARKELKLPAYYTHIQVAEYLISLFDKSYPKVRNDFQLEVKRQISFTKKLVGPTNWTRHFFNDPSISKPALNAAVAHGPQSLSVQIINTGLRRIWTELILAGKPIRILAQIHDSIFFQVPVGRTDLIAAVDERLKNPVKIHGRELVIPTARKECGAYWAKSKS